MHYLSKFKAVPQQVFYMSAGTLINRLGSAALLFLLIYLHNNKGISIRFAGLIFSSYGLGALIAGPLAGWLADKLGAYYLSIFSLLVSGLIMLLYPLLSMGELIPMTFFWGLTAEAYRPCSQVVISSLCMPEQRKIAYALNRLAINIGMSVAPLLGGILLNWNYNAIFYIDGITAILAAIFLYLVLGSHFRENPIKRDAHQRFLKSLLVVFNDKRMLNLGIAMILALMVFFQQASTLCLFMVDSLHLTTTLFGLICLLNTLLIIAMELPLNIKMADTKFNLALASSALLMGCGFGIYYFAQGIFLISLGVVIWTIGEMILFPAIAAYIFEIAPEKNRGAYMGFYTMAVNIAFVAGPLLGSFLYHSMGKLVWLVCSVVGVISAIIFYKLGRYDKAI